jgi:pimeloyl-ACP methyl ester carboxylesterase
LDDLLAAEPSVVVGHSLGGRFALDYATRRSGMYAAPAAAPAARAAAASPLATAASPLATPLLAAPPAARAAAARAAAASPLATPLLAAAAGAGGGSGAALCSGADSVLALVLVCPIGAPFSGADLELMGDLYSARNWSSAAVVARAAAGGRRADVVQTGATWARLRAPAAQALIHSDLFRAPLPEAAVRALPMPTLLCWGGSDALVPGSHLPWLARALPAHAVVKLLPAMSHQGLALGHGPAVRQITRFVRRVAEAAAAQAAGAPLVAPLAPAPAAAPAAAAAAAAAGDGGSPRRLSVAPETDADARQDARDHVGVYRTE